MFDAFNAIAGKNIILIVFVVTMQTVSYAPKATFFCPISTFGLPYTIVDGLKVSDPTYLDRILFSKSTTTYISYLVIIILYILNGTAWHVDLARSLIVHIER